MEHSLSIHNGGLSLSGRMLQWMEFYFATEKAGFQSQPYHWNHFCYLGLSFPTRFRTPSDDLLLIPELLGLCNDHKGMWDYPLGPDKIYSMAGIIPWGQVTGQTDIAGLKVIAFSFSTVSITHRREGESFPRTSVQRCPLSCWGNPVLLLRSP